MRKQKKVCLDIVDIDKKNIAILKLLLDKYDIPSNFKINYIIADTLLYEFDKRYDLVIGNPPFTKLKSKDAKKYLSNNVNKITTNTFEFFFRKSYINSRLCGNDYT